MHCRPVFEQLRLHCEAWTPEATEAVTGVPADLIVETVRTLWSSRPVAFYTWSGLEQHANTTQIIRAINVLYALTGSFDAPGGNVLFTPVPTNMVDGMELLSPEARARAIGVLDRPLGPARFEFTPGEDFYTAALDHRPYRARALVDLRRQPRHGARRQCTGPRRAGVAGLLRARRYLPQPERGPGRHRAAGGEPVRDRGVAGRFRGQPGGTGARPASPALRRAARRSTLGRPDRLCPGRGSRVG